METRTKMILALVGAGVATLVIYMITKRRSSGAQMQPGTPPNLVEDPNVAPVQLLNYNDKNNAVNVNAKPVMGAAPVNPGLKMKGHSDSVTKSSLKNSSSENTSKLSMQASTKPKMG